VAGDVLWLVTYCGVTFCEVTFCAVTFCSGDVFLQVTFCAVTFCRVETMPKKPEISRNSSLNTHHCVMPLCSSAMGFLYNYICRHSDYSVSSCHTAVRYFCKFQIHTSKMLPMGCDIFWKLFQIFPAACQVSGVPIVFW
jgi:hypothetical protein